MDGVIIDSMPYHFISWFEVLKRYNVRVSPTVIFDMEGAKWEKVVKLAFKEAGKPLPGKLALKIRYEREAIFNKYFKRYLFDGIEQTLKSLKKRGFLTGLATGSSISEAKRFLPKNLISLFNCVVAGDMVKKGKPYPDSYILTAKKLNVEPQNCLAVENAPYGIKAAKAAKMFCAAVATTVEKEKLSQADKIFKNHASLFNFLSRLKCL